VSKFIPSDLDHQDAGHHEAHHRCNGTAVRRHVVVVAMSVDEAGEGLFLYKIKIRKIKPKNSLKLENQKNH
jgi:hypothetical protein